ncbi:MAG: DNA-deoxyinosine glycosylase [Eubacterium sp.]
MINHPIDPIFDERSEILILGSFPSVKSRQEGFFYGHPQNRFWRIMAGICAEKLPQSIEEKTVMMKKHGFALWDVIKSCEIDGSSDSSIRNVEPNDLSVILKAANIKQIFVNGKKAEALYKKYLEKDTKMKAVALPSTSPANASWSEQRLFEFWQKKINEARNG